MTGSTATPPGEDSSAGPGRKSAVETTRAAGTAPAPGASHVADGGPAAERASATGSAAEVDDATARTTAPAGGTGAAAPGRSAGRSSTAKPAAVTPAAARGRNLYWLLPVLAFVGGLLIGGGVIVAADLGSSDQPAAAEPAPRATPGGTDSGSGATTITVPAACADGLDRADTAAQAAKDGLAGITQLDPAAVRSALDRLQTLQPEIRDLATRCRVGVSTSN